MISGESLIISKHHRSEDTTETSVEFRSIAVGSNHEEIAAAIGSIGNVATIECVRLDVARSRCWHLAASAEGEPTGIALEV